MSNTDPQNADSSDITSQSESEESQVSSHFQQVSLTISGPYPPPQLLAQYEDVLPGFAEKLIQRIDEESTYRRKMEKSFFDEAKDERKQSHELAQRGQIFALIVALFGLSVAAFAAVYDAQWIGTVVGGGVIVALVTAFLRKPTAKHAMSDEE